MSFWKYTPIQIGESYSMRFFRSVLRLCGLTSWVMVPCNHRSFEFKDHQNLWGCMKHLGTSTGLDFWRVHFKKNSLHMPAQLGKGPFPCKAQRKQSNFVYILSPRPVCCVSWTAHLTRSRHLTYTDVLFQTSWQIHMNDRLVLLYYF